MSAPSEPMAYAEYCGSCGNMVGAAVDRPEFANETAEFVAESIRAGNRIERVTCEFTRGKLRRCSPECSCQFCAARARAAGARLVGADAPLPAMRGQP